MILFKSEPRVGRGVGREERLGDQQYRRIQSGQTDLLIVSNTYFIHVYYLYESFGIY